MLKKAIEKIQNEMNKNNNPYVKVVGDFLLKHLEVNQGSADRILQEDKTIIKSLDEMKKVAEKRKVGNCAVLTDQEGFEIVLKYFGIEATGINTPIGPELKEDIQVKKEAPSKKEINIDFDVKLEDFI